MSTDREKQTGANTAGQSALIEPLDTKSHLLFADEIQRIGDKIGLKGRFLVDFGTDHIIEKFNSLDIARAAEMLRIAAKYIRNNCPDGTIHYDDTDCDGYCVADDCGIAADCLGGV